MFNGWVAVKLEAETARTFLCALSEKVLTDAGYNGYDSSDINVDMVDVLLTDAQSVSVDNGGPLVVGAQVTVTETPCPADGCNHWIQNLPAQVVWLGMDDEEFYKLQNAAPTVQVWYWLQ